MTIEQIVDYVLKTPFNTNRAILTAMLQELEEGDGVVQLRRDNEYNYNKIADVFIPLNGEICLVDTPRDGLRAKCGDGKTVWKDLEYADEFIIKGYYHEGAFYKDEQYTVPISGASHKIYIDLVERVIYFYDGENFLTAASGANKPASESEAGVVKLYQGLGNSIDGTMSQKAITDELDDKVEMYIEPENETIVFGYDIVDR